MFYLNLALDTRSATAHSQRRLKSHFGASTSIRQSQPALSLHLIGVKLAGCLSVIIRQLTVTNVAKLANLLLSAYI